MILCILNKVADDTHATGEKDCYVIQTIVWRACSISTARSLGLLPESKYLHLQGPHAIPLSRARALESPQHENDLFSRFLKIVQATIITIFIRPGPRPTRLESPNFSS